MEIWKNIPNSNFEISNFGEVRNRITGEIKKQYGYAGYRRVSIHSQLFLVHRLLLGIFKPIENMSSFEVNHKDGNKQNNALDNLEWVTRSENIRHSYQELGHKKAKKVYQYSAEGEFLSEYYSASEAARVVGCGQVQISECASGVYKSAMGFQWSYEKFDKIAPVKIKRYKRKIAKIDPSTLQIIEVYESASLASRENSIDQGSITKVCRGSRKTAGGYAWKYLE